MKARGLNEAVKGPVLRGARPRPLEASPSHGLSSRFRFASFSLAGWTLLVIAVFLAARRGPSAFRFPWWQGSGCTSLRCRRPGSVPWQEVVRSVAGPEKMLMALAATANYMPFVENSFASLTLLGLGHRVLFVAEEEESYAHLLTKWPHQVVRIQDMTSAPALQGEVNGTFNSTFYNWVALLKPYLMTALLELDLSVVFADGDMVWLKDPFPYFQGEYDLVLQWDAGKLDWVFEKYPNDTRIPWDPKIPDPGMCGCLIGVRPTKGAKALLQRYKDEMMRVFAEKGHPTPNQPILNAVLWQPETRALNLTLEMLPVPLFPSGCLYFGPDARHCDHLRYWTQMRERKSTPVLAHPNWLIGVDTKINNFKKHNLWLMPEPLMTWNVSAFS